MDTNRKLSKKEAAKNFTEAFKKLVPFLEIEDLEDMFAELEDLFIYYRKMNKGSQK